MAADSLASDEGYLLKVDCQKLWKIKNTLIGTARGSYAGLMFIDWYHGNQPDDCMWALDVGDDFEAIVVEKDGKIFTYNRYLVPEEHGYKDFFAIGSGGKCAMVAMDCGRTAEQAVRKACKYDLYTGGKVHSIRFDKPKVNGKRKGK